MRVLFATCNDDDYLSACLWDGFQELFGEDNVSDAKYNPNFHRATAGGPCGRIAGSRQGRCLSHLDGSSYDLLVLNAALIRDRDWRWAQGLKQYLNPSGKTVLVEGFDAADDINKPPFQVDAVFRREIGWGIDYPYSPHCCMMSAPSRWFDDSDHDDRPIDFFYAGGPAVPFRQQMCDVIRNSLDLRGQIFEISNTGVGFNEYWTKLRQAKIGLCPVGGGSDCMRHWETIAAGAIPLFVGLPPRVRQPWLPEECYGWAPDDLNDLPRIIRHLLGLDLQRMRKHLRAFSLAYHTTLARATAIMAHV